MYAHVIKDNARQAVRIIEDMASAESEGGPYQRRIITAKVEELEPILSEIADAARASSLSNGEELAADMESMYREAGSIVSGTSGSEFYDDWKSRLESVILDAFRL